MLAPRLLAVTLAFLVLGAGAAHAVPLDTAGMTKCETYGWGTDLDPKGSNLRSAPRIDAPIVGHLAPRPCAAQLTTCDHPNPDDEEKC